MVGAQRSNRSHRRWRPTLITTIIALAAQACSSVSATGTPAGSEGGSGTSGVGGASGAGGSDPITPILVGGGPGANCGSQSLLGDQAVTLIGSPREFYSWTTDEQVAELRAGGPLFSRSESPGKGRGLAMTQLAEFAAKGTEPGHALAGTLANTVFAKLRFSWPNPWATLLGFPGESYGNQLLRVTLRPEAWIASFSERGGFSVYDSNNQRVDMQIAAASPERIGAVYFESDSVEGSNYCGTYSYGAVAFREFVLGNLQMVQSWSLATPEISARLQADIAVLQAFAAELACRQLPPSLAEWSDGAQCAPRGGTSVDPRSSLYHYDLALGLPSELYWPSQENLAALIAALQASMPQGEPLVVNPGG
ncbi:MAG TPA: hypothetical protein VFK05_26195 [Polyangiaceae bacterium]|nr:hypothetical protein [Polyangiaceae bacterium]